MKGRMQKIDNDLSTCPQNNRAEPEGYVGGQTLIGMIEKNLTDTNSKVDELLEKLLDRQNLNTAYLQVVGNRGAGGIDKMSLGDYLRGHKEELHPSRRGYPQNLSLPIFINLKLPASCSL